VSRPAPLVLYGPCQHEASPRYVEGVPPGFAGFEHRTLEDRVEIRVVQGGQMRHVGMWFAHEHPEFARFALDQCAERMRDELELRPTPPAEP
jgi:hypothetical protein